MTEHPKKLDTVIDCSFSASYSPADYQGLLKAVVEEPQDITLWYFLTVMSGVGPCYVEGPTFKGYVRPSKFEPVGFVESTEPTMTLEIVPEVKK
jgi:hypothetical protein